jgi:hypothetical protein
MENNRTLILLKKPIMPRELLLIFCDYSWLPAKSQEIDGRISNQIDSLKNSKTDTILFIHYRALGMRF